VVSKVVLSACFLGEGAVESSWERMPASLHKTYHFDNYTSALEFAQEINEMSTIMDHHANMSFLHKCVDGVDLRVEFFTFEAKELTSKDYDAAKAIDTIASGSSIQMKDYTYDLLESSIAISPSSPRGSSKLMKVESNGDVSYFNNFSDSFAALATGAHIIFNESRVLNARVFVKDSGGKPMELMILDLGDVDVNSRCNDVPLLKAMLRSDQIKEGDCFDDVSGAAKIEVIHVDG
jgi:pterin-4a-carbinolamine dehydratase